MRPTLVAFIALRQLWARRGLNAAALLGVALGVLVLVTIRGILNGFHQKFLLNIIQVSPHVAVFDRELRGRPSLLSRATGDFVAASVSHAVPSDRVTRVQRPAELARAIEALPGVRAASKLLVGPAVVAYGARVYPVELRGIDPAAQDAVTPISRYVTRGSYEELGTASHGIVLGVGLADRLGAKVSDLVKVGTPSGEPAFLKVLGVFDAGIPPIDNNRAYVRRKDAENILGRPATVSRIEVRLEDPEMAVQHAAELERLFGYDAESWQETNQNFIAIFRQQSAIISFVVAAILAVGGFGILSVQVMIVLQKTRDIAILRSTGFTRRDILAVFLLQGALISLAGALIGDAGGHFLLDALGRLRIHAEGMVRSDTFMVLDDPRSYVHGLVFALGTGLVASFVPALRAARVEPVDILRGQIG